MRELRIHVPTYNAGAFPDDVEKRLKEEFGDPYVPVTVRRADGVRIVLGSLDYWDLNAPDIQVERRPGGWAIFLHPVGGIDPSGFVYFLDDGRSFVVRESYLSATPPIEMVSHEQAVRDVDLLSNENEANADDEDSAEEKCALCRCVLVPNGDNWDDLCPTCADQVSQYLDDKGLDDEDREVAIRILKHDKEIGSRS